MIFILTLFILSAYVSCVVRVPLFMGFSFRLGFGFRLPTFPLRLPPVLNGSTALAASLLVQFIGILSDLWGHIDRFLGHGVKNEPFDHRDFYGVVHAEARDHGIHKYR